jgi:hypothetical protein
VAEAELAERLEAIYDKWVTTLLVPQVLGEEEVKERAKLAEQYWLEDMEGGACRTFLSTSSNAI